MRSIEEVVFTAKRPVFSRLEAYGFTRSATRWTYQEDFLDGDFRGIVSVDDSGNVTGMVWDVVSEEEYTPIRIEAYDGAFVNTVRQAYEDILRRIADSCFDEMTFAQAQANRIADKILTAYGDEPDFPWEDENGVFRHSRTGKWYGLIMFIPLSKLTKNEDDRETFINVLNVKINPDDGESIRSRHGIYEAYHMSHKSWVSVRLDDTLSDREVMELIDVSYAYAAGHRPARTGEVKKWIVPANPKYYDIIGAFDGVTETIWKQGKGIEVGDIVYMYVAVPYSAILYKCTVTATHISTDRTGGRTNVRELMKVRIDERYPQKKCTLYKMKQYGVTTVRGPRFMPEELEKYLSEDN